MSASAFIFEMGSCKQMWEDRKDAGSNSHDSGKDGLWSSTTPVARQRVIYRSKSSGLVLYISCSTKSKTMSIILRKSYGGENNWMEFPNRHMVCLEIKIYISSPNREC
jgi:hypothetical protein